LDPKYGSTEYLEPGFSVKEEDLERFLEEFPTVIGKSTVVTMSGSAPVGIHADIYRKLTELAKAAGAKVILDTSGDYLKEGLLGQPYMIKPNKDEIEALLGIRAEDTEAVFRSALELRRKYGIPWVVISLGGSGAVLSCDEGVFHGMPPKLNPENTVGCGDSMVGAFAVALERQLAPQEALRYAVAVSAAAAMSPLTGDFDPKVFEEIYPKTVVETH
jgi:tagatose 6-phosphate kinase